MNFPISFVVLLEYTQLPTFFRNSQYNFMTVSMASGWQSAPPAPFSVHALNLGYPITECFSISPPIIQCQNMLVKQWVVVREAWAQFPPHSEVYALSPSADWLWYPNLPPVPVPQSFGSQSVKLTSHNLLCLQATLHAFRPWCLGMWTPFVPCFNHQWNSQSLNSYSTYL